MLAVVPKTRLDEIADEIRGLAARIERDTATMQTLLKEAQRECRREGRSFRKLAESGFFGIARAQCYNYINGLSSGHRVYPVDKESEFLLTPLDRLAELKRVFRINFDACPFPRPEGFDGLTVPWGSRTYVNCMFNEDVSQFVKKAIAEYRLGKLIVFVLPLCAMGAIARLLCAGASVYDLDIPAWRSIRDGVSTNPAPATARQPCVWLVLDPNGPRSCGACGHRIFG
jgi:hypothetical protein